MVDHALTPPDPDENIVVQAVDVQVPSVSASESVIARAAQDDGAEAQARQEIEQGWNARQTQVYQKGVGAYGGRGGGGHDGRVPFRYRPRCRGAAGA